MAEVFILSLENYWVWNRELSKLTEETVVLVVAAEAAEGELPLRETFPGLPAKSILMAERDIKMAKMERLS